MGKGAQYVIESGLNWLAAWIVHFLGKCVYDLFRNDGKIGTKCVYGYRWNLDGEIDLVLAPRGVNYPEIVCPCLVEKISCPGGYLTVLSCHSKLSKRRKTKISLEPIGFDNK